MSRQELRAYQPPVLAIGGVGGSGTRVVADVLSQLGFYLGGDLNSALDNLWYTLLFKRRGVTTCSPPEIERLAGVFVSAMRGQRSTDAWALERIDDLAAEDRYGHDICWLKERSTSLRERLSAQHPTGPWAWKEPNTHVFIDRLAEHVSGLRYIHVVRDGLDMAFSPNKNQLHYWADTLFDMTDVDPAQAATALRYWRLANERVTRLRESRVLPILEVGFECLCEHPTEQILSIASFCRCPITRQEAKDIGARSVRTPSTLGRHREMELTTLDADDTHYARESRSRLSRLLLDEARVQKQTCFEDATGSPSTNETSKSEARLSPRQTVPESRRP